ncbi:chromosome segregation ATPase [Nitrobacter vulgaris]|uniref:hypothetical protein n=1 Tax=Nitrobacter vulgaris TaxID=29421 RepID=UPI00285A437C|nr:hypothetical protein [Nitrobacter vulgaris]MDR6302544.1 chromosome segregation ATPase [Nitrobacter vulgaris]
MGIIDKLLGSKTAITSATIRDEISKAESSLATYRAKIEAANVSVALLSDEAHVKIENEIAVDRRAITRLEARVSLLKNDLPQVEAAEEAAQAAAKDEALRKHAEACRKANEKEAKVLLESYTEHANAIAETIARLREISDEVIAVNVALSRNPVAESIVGYDTLYRKHPDREETGSVSFRPGRYEDSLEMAVRLPPAFVGTYIWPRS